VFSVSLIHPSNTILPQNLVEKYGARLLPAESRFGELRDDAFVNDVDPTTIFLGAFAVSRDFFLSGFALPENS
jgi:hypothetical protein